MPEGPQIKGIDRFWFKTTIGPSGEVISVLAMLTAIPLSAAEADYDAAEAERFLGEVKKYKADNNINVVEILRGATS